jgi:H+/Cl- antiporter ClcA
VTTTAVPSQGAGPPEAPPDPLTLLRSPAYVRLLVLAAALGIPISALAYFFLQLVAHLQRWVFHDLPAGLGVPSGASWWPIPVLTVAGLVVGLLIRFLPGRGGHVPADGFHAGHAPPSASHVPGIALAALAGLGLGVVLGPEAPLIALGAGVAAGVVRLLQKGADDRTVAVVGATGSFAAISTLLGSPLPGAFLLMESGGLAGPMLGLVLVPGLLAAGLGTLIFIGLDSITGLGPVSLAIPDLPPVSQPELSEFAWALAIGLAAAVVGTGIRRLGLWVKPLAERRAVAVAVAGGLVIGLLGALYAATTGHSWSDVLFSGQSQLAPLVSASASYSWSALVVLLACKAVAYGVALGSFRGGPVFPAMFLGAAGAIALTHLPGLRLVPALGMGIGAMSVVMLRLPLTSVLLAAMLLAPDSLTVVPLAIVAVVVAYVASARLDAVDSRPATPADPPVPGDVAPGARPVTRTG